MADYASPPNTPRTDPYGRGANGLITNSDQHTFNSFSGADIIATITMPGISDPLSLGNLRVVSVSTRRQVVPVPVIGSVNIRGMTRSARIVAGSLVFASFDKYIFHMFKNTDYSSDNVILADMLPPFDITITQLNEYGDMSQAVIRGVTIVDESVIFSVDDAFSEQSHTYLARSYTPVAPVSYSSYNSVQNK
jgi:hypothetical protein